MPEKIRNLIPQGHVGYDRLPDQLVNKTIQKGITFNILCVGETGLGKSTLMDSLFNTTFGTQPNTHNLTTVKLNSTTYDLQENNVKMKLTIIDTKGFGDQINKEDSYKPIVEYIDAQFEAYLQEELKIKRNLSFYHDSRVHVCLYFICPTGHGLKSLDILCMKKLDNKVNIIPLIAKADTVSKTELQKFKERINQEFLNNGIKIFQFPIEDETVCEINKTMNTYIPFAIIGSNEVIRVGNKTVRARQYPWGTVQVENEQHCDFVKLREMLIRTNMEELREQTHFKHYEFYRKTRLEQMGFSDVDADNKPQSFQETCEKKIALHQQELLEKEEDMKQQFILRVKEKEAQLKEAERELQSKFEIMKDNNAQEKKKLEDEMKFIEDEIAEFTRLKLAHTTQGLSGSHHTLSLGTLGKIKKK